MLLLLRFFELCSWSLAGAWQLEPGSWSLVAEALEMMILLVLLDTGVNLHQKC